MLKMEEAVRKIAIILTEKTWQSNNQQDFKSGKLYEPTDMNKPEYMRNYNDAITEKNMGSGDVTDSNGYIVERAIWNKIKSNSKNFNQDGTLNVEKMINDLSKARKELFRSYTKGL
jgi:hypothetical protein